MTKKALPKFLIYQANQKEFHICLEAGGKFLRWCSYYLPTLDVRFSRVVTRIADMPLKRPAGKKIIDEGQFTITKSDSPESIEGKIEEGLKLKSFSFILMGKKIKGRFALKRKSNGTVLQKFKDKFAKEEDVLSGDLARTISTMVPGYDPRKVILDRPLKATEASRQTEINPVKETPAEKLTADKTIGRIEYHFAYYSSEDEPDICLVTSAKREVALLKKEGDTYVIQRPLPGSILNKNKEFTEHANALYKSS